MHLLALNQAIGHSNGNFRYSRYFYQWPVPAAKIIEYVFPLHRCTARNYKSYPEQKSSSTSILLQNYQPSVIEHGQYFSLTSKILTAICNLIILVKLFSELNDSQQLEYKIIAFRVFGELCVSV